MHNPKDEAPDDKFQIVIPSTKKDLGTLLASLLEKGQTIEKDIPGDFTLQKDDIARIYDAITARISQQNNSHKLYAYVQINYDDGTTLQIKSIEEFMCTNFIKSEAVSSLTLTMSYLIAFPGRHYPEKQQIDITFSTNDTEGIRKHIALKREEPKRDCGISFQVSHTEWTWGVDMDGVISRALKAIVLQSPQATTYAKRKWYHLPYEFVLTSLLILTLLFIPISSYFYFRSRSEGFLQAVGKLKTTDISSQFIELLVNYFSPGLWTVFLLSSISFGILMAAFIIYKFESASGDYMLHRELNFIILNKQDEERRDKILKICAAEPNRVLRNVLLNILYGILGNGAFLYISKWLGLAGDIK